MRIKKKADHHGERKILSSKIFRILYSQHNQECSRIISIIEKKEIELAEKENREPRLYEVYPHKFRHTFVTKLNESNMSPFTVSKIVGHTSVNMTNYYTHLEQDYVADEFRKFAAKYDEGKVPAVPEKE